MARPCGIGDRKDVCPRIGSQSWNGVSSSSDDDSLILYDDDLLGSIKNTFGLLGSFLFLPIQHNVQFKRILSGFKTKRSQTSGTTLRRSTEGTTDRVVGEDVKEKVMIFHYYDHILNCDHHSHSSARSS